jgi:hypothetical protein
MSGGSVQRRAGCVQLLAARPRGFHLAPGVATFDAFVRRPGRVKALFIFAPFAKHTGGL